MRKRDFTSSRRWDRSGQGDGRQGNDGGETVLHHADKLPAKIQMFAPVPRPKRGTDGLVSSYNLPSSPDFQRCCILHNDKRPHPAIYSRQNVEYNGASALVLMSILLGIKRGAGVDILIPNMNTAPNRTSDRGSNKTPPVRSRLVMKFDP